MILEDNKDIDNLFKSGVEPYTMEPSDKVWTSLDAELAKKRVPLAGKNNSGVKYISIAALLLLSFVTYQILNPSSFYNSSGSIKNDKLSQVAEKALNNSPAINSPAKELSGKPADNAGAVATTGENKTVEHVKTIQGNTASNQSMDLSAAHRSGISRSINRNRSGAHTSKLNSSPFNAIGSFSASKEGTPAQSENGSEDGTTSSGQSGNEGSGANPTTSNNASDNSPKATDDAVQSSDDAQDAAMTSDADCVGADAASNADNAAAMLTLKEAKKRFSVDVLYAREVANHTMMSNGFANSQGPTTSTEQFNFSFNAGALFRFDLNDHWSVSLGATYSTLDYSTSVSTGYVPFGFHDLPIQYLNYQDTSFYHRYFSNTSSGYEYHNNLGTINLNGSDLIVIKSPMSGNPGSVVDFTTTTRMHLQYINIPLSISFKLPIKRFDIYGGTGVAVDFLVGKQATVNIGDSYTETTNDIDGLTKATYSWLLNAGARYHLYKGLSVFVEPSYRRSITSISSGSDGFYPYYLGVNTGISIRF